MPVTVEIRNKRCPPLLKLLARHNAAFVLADQAWMPPPPKVLARHDVMTGPFLYVRLLGDRQGIEQITTSWDEVVVDRSDRLSALADALGRLPTKGNVIIFANNHFAGHAPATCREQGRLLKQR